jgi:hypothetical protein
MQFINELLALKPKLADNEEDFKGWRDFLFYISEENESLRSDLISRYLQFIYPQPIPPNSYYPGIIEEIFSIPPDQIAIYISLANQSLLSSIPIYELLNNSWAKPDNTLRFFSLIFVFNLFL